MIDVIHEINAVWRPVGRACWKRASRARSPSSRTYAAEVDDVWDACTNPERIRRWFLPVSGDLREGGRFQIEGQRERDDSALGSLFRILATALARRSRTEASWVKPCPLLFGDMQRGAEFQRDVGVRRRSQLDRGAARA